MYRIMEVTLMHTVSAAGIILAVLTFCSVCTDLLQGKIYNFITFPAILAGFLLRCLQYGSSGPPGILRPAGALLSLALPVFFLGPFRKRGRIMRDKGISAGDIKLFMAISVLMEPEVFLKCFALTFLAAAVIALMLLKIYRGSRRGVHMALPAAAAVMIHL
jgi:prepilin peptidase CpaA